ncbi:MAG: hypothetical protein RLW61_04990 [Gammaproteobacteria bacterium]
MFDGFLETSVGLCVGISLEHDAVAGGVATHHSRGLFEASTIVTRGRAASFLFSLGRCLLGAAFAALGTIFGERVEQALGAFMSRMHLAVSGR